MTRARSFWSVALSRLWLVAAALVLVGPRATALRGPLDVLSLPGDVDMAICIRGAAEASREPSAGAARQMVDELSRLMGLPSAWNELWKTLDLPADAAIDRLLGQRVLVAMRWPDEAAGATGDATGARPRVDGATGRGEGAWGEADWVVISLVTQDTERRVRERLRPAPREVQSGQAILSLEDGRFLLTTRVLADQRGRGGEAMAILMMAPSARIGLFKDMLPRLSERGAGPNLRDDPHLSRLERLLDADVAVLSIAPGKGDEGAARVADDFALPASSREVLAVGAWWRRGQALEAGGPGLHARVARLGPSLAGRVDTSVGLAPGQIDALGEGALLAVADLLWSGDGDGAGVAGSDVTSGPPGPASVAASVLAMMDLTPERARQVLGPEAVAVVTGSGREGDPIAFTLGVAVRDLSAVAPSADRLMCDVLTARGEDAVSGPDFRGMYPPAVRSAEAPMGAPAQLGGLLGPAPRVSWQFAPMEGSAWWLREASGDGVVLFGASSPAAGAEPRGPGVPQGQDGRSPWSLPGWWVVQIGHGGSAGGGSLADGEIDRPGSIRRVTRVLTGTRATRGVLTAGVARPAEVLGAMAALGVPVPPALGVARWVDRVRWEGSMAEPGRLMIDLSIDLKMGMGAGTGR